jgi:hypothetical protein
MVVIINVVVHFLPRLMNFCLPFINRNPRAEAGIP